MSIRQPVVCGTLLLVLMVPLACGTRCPEPPAAGPPATPQGASASPSATPSAPAGALVLDNEPSAAEIGEPGWLLSGGAGEQYSVRRDPKTQRNGHAVLLLAPIHDTYGKYGTWMRVVPAEPYRGKRVRISAHTKTEGTTKRADFWARAQAADSPGDGEGLGGEWQMLPASSDWTEHVIVMDVDVETASLEYGVGIAGPGKLWLDGPALAVVGNDVPATAGVYPGEESVENWLMTGVGAADYSIAADGAALRIQKKVEQTERFVAVLRVVPAGAFIGKRARVSLEVKSEGLEGGGCVAKVQRVRKLQYGGFLSSDFKLLAGSAKGYTRCDLSVEVKTGAKWIVYGFTYRGAGKAWVRRPTDPVATP